MQLANVCFIFIVELQIPLIVRAFFTVPGRNNAPNSHTSAATPNSNHQQQCPNGKRKSCDGKSDSEGCRYPSDSNLPKSERFIPEQHRRQQPGGHQCIHQQHQQQKGRNETGTTVASEEGKIRGEAKP